MFGRGTKITTRRRAMMASTTISAVQVSDRVGFSPSTRDGAGGETRSLSLPPLRQRGIRNRSCSLAGFKLNRVSTTNNRSTLRDAQRPHTRQWISLGSPGDARLPQTVAPFRRERRTFFVAPVPVDDLVDPDPSPGDRDHERIPHTRRRFCRLQVVEERGVGGLGHPPYDEIVRRHVAPTLPPRRAVGRHVQYRPRTRCSWRSHTSSRSGESTSHAWDRWLSSVWTCATTLMRPRFAAFRTTSYVSARDRCRLPRRSCAVAGPWTSKNARSASTARPPNRAMSLPLSWIWMVVDAHVGVSGGPNTSGGTRIIRRRTARFSPREIGVHALDRRDGPIRLGRPGRLPESAPETIALHAVPSR